MRLNLHHGDCLDVLRTLADNSVDSIVTDPPYGLAFMGQRWDYDVPSVDVWAECLRVLKPGGHLVAFAGTRTQHRMACRIEDAGFEIRDLIAWVYGSGFPKSLDVAKAIDKARDDSTEGLAVGAWLRQQREARGLKQKDVAALWPSSTGGLTGCVANWETLGKVPKWDQWQQLKSFIGFGEEMDAAVWRLNGRKGQPGEAWQTAEVLAVDRRMNEASGIVAAGRDERVEVERIIKAANSEAAQQWQGWGTALKPALEPITLARKPLTGTVASNVLAYGTGALNIDGCRVAGEVPSVPQPAFNSPTGKIYGMKAGEGRNGEMSSAPGGRWPANLVHDGSDEVLAAFPESKPSGSAMAGVPVSRAGGAWGSMGHVANTAPCDAGSAARFFYCAKASRSDRNDGGDNTHPTVKPTALMRWLCRLVTPPGGTVLDPFMGSGSTGRGALLEGFGFVGIEREAAYMDIAEARIGAVQAQQQAAEALPVQSGLFDEALA